MDEKKGSAIDRKQWNARCANHSETCRTRRATANCSTPFQRQPVFDLPNVFDSSESSQNSSDQEDDNRLNMTKDIVQDRRKTSQPISIPRVKISNPETMREGFLTVNRCSNSSSIGDSVYNSPKLPCPSDDFNHVMVNLQLHNDVKRTKSCNDVLLHESDGECGGSLFPLSCSLPHQPVPRRKGIRSVHFDEATITTTADLGESASRFRQLFRKKRGMTTLPVQRFGESKTITVQHEEEEEVPSPQFDRKDKNKSIFDVCNYSSYGRYT